MSGPFRELFVEIPIALMEAAVAEAQQRIPAPPAMRRRSLRLDTPSMMRVFEQRYGWTNLQVWRSEMDAQWLIRAWTGCQHSVLYRVSEQAVVACETSPSLLLDLIDGAVDAESRRCSCTTLPQR